jgi:hypothetical protein
MNNWLKGLICAGIFFVVLTIITSFIPESSNERRYDVFIVGGILAESIFTIAVAIAGFYSGYKLYQRYKSNKNKPKRKKEEKRT